MKAPPTAPRIVSILPAATEIVYAIGAGAQLVGASHECDHPEAARTLPRVSRPRVNPRLGSRELDAQVRALRGSGESLYELDTNLIARLRPDLILTQVECDVCAVTPKDLETTLEKFDPKPQVVTLDAQGLEGVLADIRKLGQLLGRTEEARLLLFRQWRLTKEIRQRVRDLKPPLVALVDWVDPLMFAGHWMPELASIAGGRYELVAPGKPSRWGSWEELEEYEPEVLFCAPCGRSVQETRMELAQALRAARAEELPAVEEGKIFCGDGNALFNRPGPRLIYSAALMARAFHPEQVPPLPDSLERQMVRLEPARV